MIILYLFCCRGLDMLSVPSFAIQLAVLVVLFVASVMATLS